jgi:hypothetical protein
MQAGFANVYSSTIQWRNRELSIFRSLVRSVNGCRVFNLRVVDHRPKRSKMNRSEHVIPTRKSSNTSRQNRQAFQPFSGGGRDDDRQTVQVDPEFL